MVRSIEPEKKWYRALWFRDDHLVGGLLIGKGNRAGKRRYLEAIKAKTAVPESRTRSAPALARRLSAREVAEEPFDERGLLAVPRLARHEVVAEANVILARRVAAPTAVAGPSGSPVAASC